MEIIERMDLIDTTVYNPGLVDVLSRMKMINSFMQILLIWSTAAEYSGLGLSANDYKKYDLTAYEYAVR